ncbi:PstS family phosphate ABC transporter substrate-binding protein [Gaopeijia maritima]|uniref:PstS family phosphate ABC transporter substrate-binding protein n=1 Tax=Gaopeijia maritima TaxID=3119007 RepID=UPI00324DD5B0
MRARLHAPSLAATLIALLPIAGCVAGVGEPIVRTDGSSTVYPMAEALAEAYREVEPFSRVVVSRSGTGGGLSRLCAGEIDIAHASRPPTAAEEANCAGGGIELVLLPLALDGVSVVTHRDNAFVDCLTLDELRRIWAPGSAVRTWRDIRAEFPNRPLELFGAGPGSGTFDSFTDAVVGRRAASRTDYQASEDDNVLVQGVAGDPGALGYFGYGYVVANRDRLKLLAVDGGNGCVLPDPSTIASGRYRPLSRSLYLVVSRSALTRAVVRDYLDFVLEQAPEAARRTGSIALPDSEYRRLRAELEA